MYILGIMGATRRLDHYDKATGYQPFFIIMLLGGLVLAVGLALQLVQIFASLIQRGHLRDKTGDPWNGRTLEWATASPPPFYNFTVIPHVLTRDAFLDMKRLGQLEPQYEDIIIPKNTAVGIYIAAWAFLLGFGFVWHINWMPVVAIIGIIIVFIRRAFDDESEYVLPAAEVQKLEAARLAKLQSHLKAQPLADEEDMSVIDFVKYVLTFGLDIIRTKKWKSW